MTSYLETVRLKALDRLHRTYVTTEIPPPLERLLAALERLLFERGINAIAIEQPIFIVGCHRSGTTVLYEALATHPDVAYFTNASNSLPGIPILSNRLMHLAGMDSVRLERFLQDDIYYTATTPNEGIRIWELYAPENGDYYLDESHENPEMERYLCGCIRKHLKYFGATRFLNKNPDNSVRIRYLNKLFPDAFFIHIVRDGRAVCSSLLKSRDLASAFFGSEHRHAKSATKVQGWDEISAVWDEQPVAGSGMLWRAIMDTIERDRQAVDPSRFLEIRYEDFVTEPFNSLQRMATFCQLRWDTEIEMIMAEQAAALQLGGRNEAWKKRLTADDVDRLLTVIGPTMRAYGYAI